MNAVTQGIRWLGRNALDFALPARCAGCGAITDLPHQFCAACWQKVDWLGQGCDCCGTPLEATDADQCARCMAQTPIIARTRAAMAYGDIARVAGAAAQIFAQGGACGDDGALHAADGRRGAGRSAGAGAAPLDADLVGAGFNQSGLIAAKLANLTGLAHRPTILERVKRTRSLKNMSPKQRADEVRAAFKVSDEEAVKGQRFLLVDDVLTSGSTSDACAKALLRAGAERVDLICFARVVRPRVARALSGFGR